MARVRTFTEVLGKFFSGLVGIRPPDERAPPLLHRLCVGDVAQLPQKDVSQDEGVRFRLEVHADVSEEVPSSECEGGAAGSLIGRGASTSSTSSSSTEDSGLQCHSSGDLLVTTMLGNSPKK